MGLSPLDRPADRFLEILRHMDLTYHPTALQSCWQAQCPSHEDRRPSLRIREAENGRLLVKCYAGCRTENVLAAMGLQWTDLFPRSAEESMPSGDPWMDKLRTLYRQDVCPTCGQTKP